MEWGSLRSPANFASQSSPVPEASIGSNDTEPKRAKKRRCFSNPKGFQQLSNDANLRHEEHAFLTWGKSVVIML